MIYCAVIEIDVLVQLAFTAVRMLGASVHIWNFATSFLGVSVPNIRSADSKWKLSVQRKDG
jgi:hypothetical protein